MYIVYTSPDGITRARAVDTFREAGQVIAALKMQHKEVSFHPTIEQMKEALPTCLPIIVSAWRTNEGPDIIQMQANQHGDNEIYI